MRTESRGLNGFWLASLMLALAAGCTPKAENKDDPKTRLNEYVSRSFAVKGVDDRKALSSYLTGEAKSRLDAWSDEQFQAAFIDSKRKFIKLAFKELKPVSATEASLTYELTYQSKNTRVTQRKLAQMVKPPSAPDQWLISEVRSIKELVEYTDEMSLP
jgi:hypothetical protein